MEPQERRDAKRTGDRPRYSEDPGSPFAAEAIETYEAVNSLTPEQEAIDSFFEAAEEAAISRLYGGIHFRSAIVDGLAQGRCIGHAISALPLRF